MKKRKLSMFKNDPFGIKWKIFCIRMKWLMKKGIKVRSKLIAAYLYVINAIGIPRNETQTDILKRAVDGYDKTVQEIEHSLRYARMYVKDGEDNEQYNCG